MNVGLYQSAAAMASLERWQDAVSQNISSSQVPGFRQRTVAFSAEDTGEFKIANGSQDSSESAQPASFPTTTNGVSLLQGETQPTGRPLDVAIESNGFFEVTLPDGSQAYTRGGAFSLRSDGTLVNVSNDPVMSESGSPIVSSPTGGPLTIGADGYVSQGATQLARLSVKSFANPSALTPISGGLFLAGSGNPATQMAHPDLMQGYLEASNVSPLHEMVNLVMITRAYEANQKVITNADQQTQKTMDALG